MPTDHKGPGQGMRVNARSHGAWLLLLLILSGLLLAYGPVLDGPLFFDDEPNLLDNPYVQLHGRTFDAWRRAVVSNDSGPLHRPVAMFSFALNYVFAGEFSAFGLKAVNLLIHLGIGVLVYGLASTIMRAPALVGRYTWSVEQRRLVALAAASVWLLHPLHVSTVLYAVQRMAQLSALFTLAALLLFMRYRLRWADKGAGPGEVIAAALWLCTLGVLATLSKENGAVLPWLLLVLEVTLFRGLWGGRCRPALARLTWLALVLPAVVIIGVALFKPGLIPGSYASREFNLEERLLTQGRALWLYLQWLAVPDITQMGFFHDDIPLSRSLWSPVTTGVSLVAWGAVLVFSLVAYARYPLLAFAFLFYLVGHSVESTVLPLELYFEHRNYLPSVGFAILLAAGIMQLAQRTSKIRFVPVVAAWALLLIVLLIIRGQAWEDERSLARYNVVNHPDSPRANFYYALTLMDEFEAVKTAANDPERERVLAVATRAHFMRMYELDPRQIAGVVMLYQFDNMHFPAAAQRQDWLGVLAELVKTRKLHSSDVTALDALVTFVAEVPDPAQRQRVAEILHSLIERYPHRGALVEDLYRLQLASGGDRVALLPLLERTLQLNKSSTQPAALMVGYYGRDDVPAAIEAVREWMRRDTLHREIPVYRALLEP